MNLFILQILSFFALRVFCSSLTSGEQQMIELLFVRKEKFTVQEYQELLDQGATVEDYHLLRYRGCTDPDAFFVIACQHGVEITEDNLKDNFSDREAFELFFHHASDEVKTAGLLRIFEMWCSMDVNVFTFSLGALALATYAGAAGLVVPEYINWFTDTSFLDNDPEYEKVSVDFLRFYMNNGVNFNTPSFTDGHYFEQFISTGRYDLADYMADHGARIPKTKEELREFPANPPAMAEKYMELFVARRAWMNSVIREFLAGTTDPNSPLSFLPREIPLNLIGSVLAELFEADTYKEEPSQ